MTKFRLTFAVLVFVAFACAAPLHAQDGCVDSPENPTIILAGLGTAGFAVSSLRSRWKARARR